MGDSRVERLGAGAQPGLFIYLQLMALPSLITVSLSVCPEEIFKCFLSAVRDSSIKQLPHFPGRRAAARLVTRPAGPAERASAQGSLRRSGPLLGTQAGGGHAQKRVRRARSRWTGRDAQQEGRGLSFLPEQGPQTPRHG